MSSALSVKQLRAKLRDLGVTDLTHCLEKEDLIQELKKAEENCEIDIDCASSNSSSYFDKKRSMNLNDTSSSWKLNTSSVSDTKLPNAIGESNITNDDSSQSSSESIQLPSSVTPKRKRENTIEDSLRDELSHLLYYESNPDNLKILKEKILQGQWEEYGSQVSSITKTCPICLMEITNPYTNYYGCISNTRNDSDRSASIDPNSKKNCQNIDNSSMYYPPIVQFTDSHTGDECNTNANIAVAYHNRCLARHIIVKCGDGHFPVKWPVPTSLKKNSSGSISSSMALCQPIPFIAIRQALINREYSEQYLLAYNRYNDLQEKRRQNRKRRFDNSTSARNIHNTVADGGKKDSVDEDSFELPENIRRCPECSSLIEKVDPRLGIHGCDNMTCRCGCKFCYKCGAVFSIPGSSFTKACNCSGDHGFFDGDDVRNNYRGLFDGNIGNLLGNLGHIIQQHGANVHVVNLGPFPAENTPPFGRATNVNSTDSSNDNNTNHANGNNTERHTNVPGQIPTNIADLLGGLGTAFNFAPGTNISQQFTMNTQRSTTNTEGLSSNSATARTNNRSTLNPESTKSNNECNTNIDEAETNNENSSIASLNGHSNSASNTDSRSDNEYSLNNEKPENGCQRNNDQPSRNHINGTELNESSQTTLNDQNSVSSYVSQGFNIGTGNLLQFHQQFHQQLHQQLHHNAHNQQFNGLREGVSNPAETMDTGFGNIQRETDHVPTIEEVD